MRSDSRSTRMLLWRPVRSARRQRSRQCLGCFASNDTRGGLKRDVCTGRLHSGQIMENKEPNYWMAVGSVDNWSEAFRLGNIWGLEPKRLNLWENVQLND